MNILMLTPYLPYPTNSGGQIRSYNLIKHLSQTHNITLCSLIKETEEKKYVEYLKPFCKNVFVFKRPQKPWTLKNIIKTGFSLYPFLVIRNFSPSEKKALPKIIFEGSFDIIHAETFYVSPHIPKTNIPIVLVDQTIEYQVYQHYVENFKHKLLKPLLFIDVLKIKFWETYFWKKATRVVAVSEKDAEVMRSTVYNLNVSVVPNGVGDDLIDDVPLHYNKKILFMGNYAWLQNSEAARKLATEIFPKIAQEVPEAKLIIAGQFAQKLKDLETEKIIVRDFAIDDIKSVQKYYRESGILIAPLYGPGGTRLKILGAMAAKLPVVTTKIGNEGIDAPEDEAILVGEDIYKLASLAIKLLTDKSLYKKIAINGRKFALKNYSYDNISRNLSKIYEESTRA